jgi:putative transposase
MSPRALTTSADVPLISANDSAITISATLPEFRYNTSIRAVPEQDAEAIAQTPSKTNLAVVPARVSIVKWILNEEGRIGKRGPVIDKLLALYQSGSLPRVLQSNLERCTKRGKLPSRSSLFAWVADYSSTGGSELALRDAHTGRRRTPQPWDLRALQMYHIPSKPGFADVADWLQLEGFAATGAQVRRFIQSLPTTYGPHSAWRVGKRYFQLNKGAYKSRDRASLDVGEMYEGDGHTVDVYCQHESGVPRPYRIELTVWMDVRSEKIVGWFPSHAESSLTTLFSLSHAILGHDHVPTFVHIDNGAGFKARMLSDESVGFYEKMSITQHTAIVGNAKGKGDIERWFGFFRNKHDKRFAVDYCGHDQAEETNRRISAEMKSGKRQLVPLADYLASVQAFIDWYNNRPQKALGNRSPNEVWEAGLTRNPVILKELATVRPSKMAVARRSEVKIHNRIYLHPTLSLYDGKSLEVEYDIRDDKQVWIYDDKKRLLCIAPLKTKQDWLPADRREEAREKAIRGREQRREKQMELDRMEEARITHQNNEQYAELYDMQQQLPEPTNEPGWIEIDIDLHDFE